MANINFYLKPGKLNKNGEKSLIMRITFGNDRTMIFLNKMVKPKHWSTKHVVKAPGKNEPDNYYENINKAIITYRNKAEEALRHAIDNNIVLSDKYFKSWFTNDDIDKTLRNKNFFELFDLYLEAIKPDRAAQTIRGYKTVRNYLEDFEKESYKFINIKAIDINFFDALKKYALTKMNIGHNYFAKIVTVLKSFLYWVKEHKVAISDDFKSFSFTEKEKEVIFLTIDELMTLYNHKFELDRHTKARDIYCFGCFTGLRVSDILELKREHIKDGSIHKLIKKTKAQGIIPLNLYALEILDKYSQLPERPLPQMCAQKLNKYIKECCKIAEIDQPTVITKFYGGRAEEKIFPKHELITTHTARKTFITNSILLGMNETAAKGISGHKKDKDFRKYLKVVEEFKKTEMDKAWGSVGKSNDDEGKK